MKIAFLHQYEDYENSLPILITRKLLGAGFEVTTPSRADIVFIGQFSGRRNRGLRKYWNAVRHRSDIPNPSALRIFQNYENTRPDGIDANYRITSDLGSHPSGTTGCRSGWSPSTGHTRASQTSRTRASAGC
jgi:hypothetical protein